MINLLPSGRKQDILYARRNTKLLHWVVAMLAVIVGTLVLVVGGHFYIASAISHNQQEVSAATKSLQDQHLDETQKQIQDFSNNLKLIIKVLSQEVLFSKLLKQIGSVMPANSVLSTIEISQVQGGLDLSASAKDYDTATQIQVNLQDPQNKLFEKVDIVAISCTKASPEQPYPCSVTLRALFAGDNAFTFINGGKDSKNE